MKLPKFFTNSIVSSNNNMVKNVMEGGNLTLAEYSKFRTRALCVSIML